MRRRKQAQKLTSYLTFLMVAIVINGTPSWAAETAQPLAASKASSISANSILKEEKRPTNLKIERISEEKIKTTPAKVETKVSASLKKQMRVMGTNSGGGGTLCKNPNLNSGQPTLLDFANRSFQNNEDILGTDKLKRTKISDYIGFDRVDVKNMTAYKLALQKIESLSQTSPVATRLLKASLQNLRFFQMPYTIKKIFKADLSQQRVCKDDDLQTLIYFKDGYAYISAPAWNATGLLSHVGVLIHESLRVIQMYREFNGSDLDLQRITEQIVFDKPEKNPSLDELSFFNSGFILNQKLRLQKEYTDFIEICSELKTFSQKSASFKDIVNKSADGLGEKCTQLEKLNMKDKVANESMADEKAKELYSAMNKVILALLENVTDSSDTAKLMSIHNKAYQTLSLHQANAVGFCFDIRCEENYIKENFDLELTLEKVRRALQYKSWQNDDHQDPVLEQDIFKLIQVFKKILSEAVETNDLK